MEGPSVHRVADELAGFAGQTIQSATGNAKQPLGDVEGSRIDQVRAVKKRLFLDTTDRHIVIHFLMYGSYRVNEERELDERLSLDCDRDTLNVYSCSVKILDPEASELQRYDQPAHDVLAAEFDRGAAESAISSRDDPVADILLDQDVFGGVGNIIKNEVLWEVGIHPGKPGNELTPDTAQEVVTSAISWAEDWYERKQAGKELRMRIYRADTCPSCGAAVAREELGEHDRVTYWCKNCQSP